MDLLHAIEILQINVYLFSAQCILYPTRSFDTVAEQGDRVELFPSYKSIDQLFISILISLIFSVLV